MKCSFRECHPCVKSPAEAVSNCNWGSCTPPRRSAGSRWPCTVTTQSSSNVQAMHSYDMPATSVIYRNALLRRPNWKGVALSETQTSAIMQQRRSSIGSVGLYEHASCVYPTLNAWTSCTCICIARPTGMAAPHASLQTAATNSNRSPPAAPKTLGGVVKRSKPLVGVG